MKDGGQVTWRARARKCVAVRHIGSWALWRSFLVIAQTFGGPVLVPYSERSGLLNLAAGRVGQLFISSVLRC